MTEKYKVLVAVSGMVAFAIPETVMSAIDEYISQQGWKEIPDIPQYRRKLYHVHYEVLVKLLPRHWLNFEYEQDGAEFNFWGGWISDEQANELLAEKGWERCYYILSSPLAVAYCGCTGNMKRLSQPR